MTRLSKSFLILLALMVAVVQCRVARETNEVQASSKDMSAHAEDATIEGGKQLFLGAEGKETNTPNFVRLVVMRLIYGLASSMGVEERLESAFNGVLKPPNADEGIFNFGDLLGGGGDGGGEDGVFGGLGDLLDY